MPTNSRLNTAILKIQGILAELRGGVTRKVEAVELFDPSPANYASVDEYCRSCLIDVNGAAGRSVKSQSHCLLPIRRAGDASNVMLDKALIAAAESIVTAVKPDDVPEDAWEAATRAAAVEIVEGYKEIDAIAPAGVYEIAGLEHPEDVKRALAYSRMYDQIWALLEDLEAERGAWLWLVDVYEDRGERYAIVAQDGMLFRVPVTVEDDNVFLGDFTRVQESFIPIPRSQENITRAFKDDNGRVRVVQIAATAVLNRNSEIDSRDLFDSFVEFAKNYRGDERYSQYGEVNFHHYPEIRLGEIDYIARDGYCFIVSYVFDDTEIGRAAGEGFLAEPDFWGASIEFVPTAEPEIVQVNGVNGEQVDIKVYTRGINTGLAILHEKKAAALFTNGHVHSVERSADMNESVYADLQKLVGSSLADEIAEGSDATNRTVVENGLIAREASDQNEVASNVETAVESEEEVEVTDDENTDEAANDNAGSVPEFELDDTAIAAIAEAVTETDAFQAVLSEGMEIREQMKTVATGIAELMKTNQRQARQLEEAVNRVQRLERGEQEKRNEWIADVPQRRSTTLTARPRAVQQPANAPASRGVQDSNSIAENTLSGIPNI